MVRLRYQSGVGISEGVIWGSEGVKGREEGSDTCMNTQETRA